MKIFGPKKKELITQVSVFIVWNCMVNMDHLVLLER